MIRGTGGWWPPATTDGFATRWVRCALVSAIGAATLLAGPLAAPDEARRDRPAAFTVPDGQATLREPPSRSTQTPPDGPPPSPDPPSPTTHAPPGGPPTTREPRSGSGPGPPDGSRVLQVPAPPDGAGIPAPGARYAWPLLPAPTIGARFRAPPHPYGRGHRGVDLVGAAGQPVLAARAGTVVFAGPIGTRSVVSVDHDDGLRTTYEPVRPTVRPGVLVRAGDVLGLLDAGHPGCPAEACLHWGVRRGPQEYLDPLVLLRPPEVRLLPVPNPWPQATSVERAPNAILTAPPGSARTTTTARNRALSPPRAPPACRGGGRPAGCAAGTPGTR